MSPVPGKKKVSETVEGKIYHKVKRKINKPGGASDSIVYYTSKIRAIGNSQGIILNNEIMRVAK